MLGQPRICEEPSFRFMKTRIIGFVSVLLNLALLAAAGIVFSKKSAPAVPAVSVRPEENTPVRSHAAAVADPVLKRATTASSARMLNWRDIESSDYKIYIARLRAIGCPETTLRDIIVADVNKLYAKKRATIRQGSDKFVYWKGEEQYELQKDYYPKLRQERAAEREKRALLRELLGFEPGEHARRESGTYDYLEWQYDFLTGDKRERAGDFQENYLDLQRELYPGNRSDPEVRRQLRALFQKRLAELATVLTPQELEEYNLRSSHGAEALRNVLDGFDPTASEFKQIFYIRQKRDADLALLDPDNQDAVTRFRQATAGTDAEIKTLLGDERFARYQRAQDPAYKQLVHLAEARDLTTDTPERVFEVKAATEDAVRKIRADPNLTPDERNMALAKIRADASNALTKLVGEKNLNLYRNRGGGWIQTLGR